MKTKLLFFTVIAVVLLLGFSNNKSTTTLEGIVSDKDTNTPLGFAYVKLYKKGILITGTQTDLNGKYFIKYIKPGKYDIEASYLGYEALMVKDFKIKKNKSNILNFTILPSSKMLDCVVVTEYKTPLINMDNTVTGSTVTAQKISRLQKKSILNYEYDYEEEPGVSLSNESYGLPDENPFVSVEKEALSTFSIDVDRAAYSNIRRYLNMGKMPPKDAVRIEEMINYFDYDYKIPDNGEIFHVYSNVTSCPWNRKHQILHLALNTKNVKKADLVSSNLVFLIDVSGSMDSYNKLPLVISSFKLLLEQLRPEDRVAIVVYAGAAGCPLPSTKVADKKKIIEALDKLSAGGLTAGGAGIELAYKIAKDNFIKGGNNRVILATDGDFNVGVSSNEGLEKLIEKKRKENIFLSVLGFGMGNYKSDKMQILADKGNGNHAYIDNMNEARKVFLKEFTGTLYTLAKDVKIQIEFNPAFVQAYRLIGYENRMLNKEDFNNDKVDAGEIGIGHSVTALYEIIPAGIEDDYTGKVDNLTFQENKEIKYLNKKDLALFKIRYKKPDEDKSKKIQFRISPNVVKPENAGTNTQFALAVAQFGLLLKDSKYKEKANYDSVLKYAKMSKGKDDDGLRSEFINLVKTAKAIDSEYVKE